VQERRRLSFVGLVAIAIALNRRGDALGEPDVAIDGIPTETAAGKSMEVLVLDAVDGTLASIPQPKRRDRTLVRDAVKRAVRAAVEQAWGKKPIVKVLITVIDAKR
jgi:ribonuclease J